MNAPLLDISGVRYTWPGQARPVLDAVAFRMQASERVFLHGPSGSGKSTLMALIGGLVRPDRGAIRLAGSELTGLSGAARDRFRADHLGVIFQQFNLLPWLSALDNAMLPCRFSRARAERAGDPRRAARGLLEAMDLEPGLWMRRADELSVGQQQRVAAARALIGSPALVLADEPTSALDADRRQAFITLLFDQARAAGSAVLFVSHDRSLADAFDRAVALDALAGRDVPA